MNKVKWAEDVTFFIHPNSKDHGIVLGPEEWWQWKEQNGNEKNKMAIYIYVCMLGGVRIRKLNLFFRKSTPL